ncbi:MAG: hypothetical protein HYR70_14315 [Chloroflexi bacterium]|nr:hypothetical protein [Chloroflexota bacterium]MBI1854984.1 hypothetical protein [Chloroflexota bacterium]MBI3339807.1 hypothetical protein [Chloroflexota bacterium]
MARRLRILLGVLLLALSCGLLLWGFWPAARERYILPVNPSEMSLPTPSSFDFKLELNLTTQPS